MFESIKSLRPYFHSLREVKENVSLDIKLPLNWTYVEILKPYSSVSIKVQDKNESFNLVSLISQSTQNGYDVVLAAANEVIKVNKELEEKEKLFQEKVKELEQLFKKESLEKLKEISLLNDGQEVTASSVLVSEGDGKRQKGNKSSQDPID